MGEVDRSAGRAIAPSSIMSSSTPSRPRPNASRRFAPTRKISGRRSVRESPSARGARRPAGMPRSLIATYAPGTNPQVAPAGTAFRLEPGSVLELQMHYTTNGQATTDRTSVGFVFSD